MTNVIDMTPTGRRSEPALLSLCKVLISSTERERERETNQSRDAEIPTRNAAQEAHRRL